VDVPSDRSLPTEQSTYVFLLAATVGIGASIVVDCSALGTCMSVAVSFLHTHTHTTPPTLLPSLHTLFCGDDPLCRFLPPPMTTVPRICFTSPLAAANAKAQRGPRWTPPSLSTCPFFVCKDSYNATKGLAPLLPHAERATTRRLLFPLGS
jgi:hypothetical protein